MQARRFLGAAAALVLSAAALSAQAPQKPASTKPAVAAKSTDSSHKTMADSGKHVTKKHAAAAKKPH